MARRTTGSTRSRMTLAVISLSMVGMTVDCSSSGAGSGGGDLIEAVWTVTSLAGHDPLPSGVRMEATFDDDRISGSDGCNSYGGPYATAGEGDISIGGLQSTLIGCEDQVNRVAAAYAAALDAAVTYRIDDGTTLTLFDGEGGELVRFTAGGAPPITGLPWVATAYRDGRVVDPQAMTTPADSSTVSAEFGSDGRLSGSTGCNRYTTTYSITDDGIDLGPVATTRMACEPALQRQEQAYLKALEASTSWKFSGPAFQLLNTTGTVEVTYAPGP